WATPSKTESGWGRRRSRRGSKSWTSNSPVTPTAATARRICWTGRSRGWVSCRCGTHQALINLPSFDRWQHLSRIADRSDDFARPDAAPPHLEASVRADPNGLCRHRLLPPGRRSQPNLVREPALRFYAGAAATAYLLDRKEPRVWCW